MRKREREGEGGEQKEETKRERGGREGRKNNLELSCIFQPAALKAVVTRQGNPHFLAAGQGARV